MLLRSPLVLCAVIAALVAPDAWAQRTSSGKSKLDSALSSGADSGSNSGGGNSGGKTRVIVQYRAGSGERVRRKVQASGGKVHRQHQIIDAVSAEMDQKQIRALTNDPDVTNISLDARVKSHGGGQYGELVNRSSSNSGGRKPSKTENTYLLGQIVGVPAGLTGKNIGVAIIDSGIAESADVRVAVSVDFRGYGEPRLAEPSDEFGHGTHVAGLIAGNGALSNGKYRGVATGVRLYSFKVLDQRGEGYTSDVIEALDVAALYPDIRIINLSLGHPIYEAPERDPLVRAVERAVRKGILVVTSAGNHGRYGGSEQIGYAGITSPGNAPSALTVGSMRTLNTVSRLDDSVSSFSSRGPTWFDGQIKPDIVAPGENLVAITSPTSTLYARELLRADIAPYISLSGTSMATAVATGVAALMMEANYLDEGFWKRLTPNTIKAILQHTAIHVPDTDPTTPDVLEQGAGGINAEGAAKLAAAIEPSAPLGSFWLETPVVASSTYDGVLLAWSSHIVWGDSVVGQDAIFWRLPAWDGHIVWGDHILWGEYFYLDWHIVWGDLFDGVNVVAESFDAWSNQIVWGDGLVKGTAEQIVWGDLLDWHIVWGDVLDWHIVWGDGVAVYNR